MPNASLPPAFMAQAEGHPPFSAARYTDLTNMARERRISKFSVYHFLHEVTLEGHFRANSPHKITKEGRATTGRRKAP